VDLIQNMFPSQSGDSKQKLNQTERGRQYIFLLASAIEFPFENIRFVYNDVVQLCQNQDVKSQKQLLVLIYRLI